METNIGFFADFQQFGGVPCLGTPETRINTFWSLDRGPLFMEYPSWGFVVPKLKMGVRSQESDCPSIRKVPLVP